MAHVKDTGCKHFLFDALTQLSLSANSVGEGGVITI